MTSSGSLTIQQEAPVDLPNSNIENIFCKNTLTDIHLSYRLYRKDELRGQKCVWETGGKFRQGVTYFVLDIILGSTV